MAAPRTTLSDKNTESPPSALRSFGSGFCMGSADLIPGISGGTVALILGVWEPLMAALSALSRFSYQPFKEAMQAVPWKFLLSLLFGIATAVVLLVQLVAGWLADPFGRTLLYAFFLGLVVASTRIVVQRISAWSFVTLLTALIAGIGAYSLSSQTRGNTELAQGYSWPLAKPLPSSLRGDALNYDVQTDELRHLSRETVVALVARGQMAASQRLYDEQQRRWVNAELIVEGASSVSSHSWSWLAVFGSGVLAVSAALLPGISGSYLLNIIGMYGEVIASLSLLVRGAVEGKVAYDPLFFLTTFTSGIVCGALIFSKVASWLLRAYHDLTMAALVGFMVGALRSLWPFWSYAQLIDPLHIERGPQLILLEPLWPSWGEGDFWIALLVLLGGMGATFLLEYGASKSALKSPLDLSHG